MTDTTTSQSTIRKDVVDDHSSPRPTWRTRLTNWAFGQRVAHNILYLRARDLVEGIHFKSHLVKGGVYIDIGSGTGHNSARMARVANGFDARLIAIEPVSKPTKRVLAHIRRKVETPIEFIRGVGNALPQGDDSADGVSVFFVLHHIPYAVQLEVLAEIIRVLKPGGKLFIWEDTPENEQEFLANETWDRRLNFEPKSEPHFYRSGDDWAKLFDEHGFTVLERVYYEDHSRRAKEGLIRHTGFVLQVAESASPLPPPEKGEGNKNS